MCTAEAAIQRSLAWLRFCSGWPRSGHACRSSAMVVSRASLTGTTVDAWIDASKAPPPRLAPPGHEGAVSELRQRRGKPPGGSLDRLRVLNPLPRGRIELSRKRSTANPNPRFRE